MKTFALAIAVGAMIACASPAIAGPLGIEERLAIIEKTTDIAAGSDRHQWDRVRAAFADEVTLDYTSLWGGEPVTQPADEVVAQWSAFLPSFDATVHLVSNHTISSATASTAVAEADFQAVHTLAGDMWTLFGRYRLDRAAEQPMVAFTSRLDQADE
jgi:hypothetical protein